LTRIKARAPGALQAAPIDGEQSMSTFTIVFVGMVITAMSALVAALAWACWYTREGAVKAPPAEQAEPEIEHRKAA
jgi:hypothetical protein